MEIDKLVQKYEQHARTQKMVSWLTTLSQARLYLQGGMGSATAFIAAATYLQNPQTYLFVLDSKEEAAYFQNDLKALLLRKEVHYFPDSFKKINHFLETNKSNLLLRTEAINHLINSKTTGEIVVTYPEALFEKVVAPKVFNQTTLHIATNETLDTNTILEILVEYGFERTDFVFEPGQFSIRGGIIDLFSFGNDLPYRIELFGNEVETIRLFDPISQLSVRKLANVSIVPNIQSHFDSTQKTVFLNILPKNAIVWVKNMDFLLQKIENSEQQLASFLQTLQNKNVQDLLPPDSPFKTEEKVSEIFAHKKQLLEQLLNFSIVEFGDHNHFNTENVITCTIRNQPVFNKKIDMLIYELKQNQKNKLTNYLFASTPRQFKRLQAIFDDHKANIQYTPLVTEISSGFIDYDLQISCFTDHQIFERFHKYQIKQAYSKDQALTVQFLKQLSPGDYVTHIDHGIGIFSGLETITTNGQPQEVIKICYKDTDVLYVHINSLHKVSKYVGKEGNAPKIHKLGSDTWSAVKRKAKYQIKDIAKDLIKLYAQRKASKGFAFNKDTYLQTELEASFMYEDTPDQIKATDAVKRDMEAQAPMDRLVCGDVGFGKTEIAIRATAKALADGKQVAILVPTTILAMQHYKTFAERLKQFPCNISFISRMRTAKEKKQITEQLAEGKIDVLIGTHAIIADKIKFKDLGLLVIDEEQKFGVGAKEKLRQMKTNVDTLTLTATPIPRTLQFSLMNARDMSVLNTPPANRQPIQTELHTFSEELVRDAVNYELDRNGQVFFIHNRVSDIAEITGMIQRICPDSTVGFVHGQMPPHDLEERMEKFITAQYDVLVATNLIESGLDIPNANTIIINNAHYFGLSDLHQMRGRVGRSNRKAFCYLLSLPRHALPENARKRLKAIEQFSDLGSGFHIAMQDLDIRGAGNILGAEQSGFISDIGINTYQKILKEAILELKENEFQDIFKEETMREQKYVQDCQIDTDTEMLIPNYYVQNSAERLKLYTQLDDLENEDELQKFADQLTDRFGKMPQQVRELFNGLRLRWIAKTLGFEKIILKSQKLRCVFVENPQATYYQSNMFTSILQYIHINQRKMHLKESPRMLSLIIENIKTIKETYTILKEMHDTILQQDPAALPTHK